MYVQSTLLHRFFCRRSVRCFSHGLCSSTTSRDEKSLKLPLTSYSNVVASGKVRINVNQRFALKDAADAHKALEARATSGSTVLTI